MKAIKEENIDKEAVAIVTATDCTELEYEELQQKHSKTREEQLKERKHSLKRKYGEKHLSETLKKLDDTRGWHSQIRLHYYLTYDRTFVKLRDILHIEGHKQRGAGKVCAQDLRLLSVRVGILEKLGVLNFLDGREITKHDPEVKVVAAICLKGAADLRRYFGITVTAEIVEKAPVRVIQNLLRLIGLRLDLVEQRRQPGTGERERVYAFRGGFVSKLEPLGLREAIFAEWERRDIESLSKHHADMFLDGVA